MEAATTRPRGLGVSRADLEASRLVFVYVRDSKPRRKVAVPVLDSYTMDQFLDQVKAKLKLNGISEITLASSGQRIINLRDLQDIDELCVVEAPAAGVHTNGVSTSPGTGSNAAVLRPGASGVSEILPQSTDNGNIPGLGPSSTGNLLRQQSAYSARAASMDTAVPLGTAASVPRTISGIAALGSDDDAHAKYAKRAHPLKRTLQRLFPTLFTPGLPITIRDASEGDASKVGRRRRARGRAGSFYNTRTLLMVLATITCVSTMLYLFVKVAQATPKP